MSFISLFLLNPSSGLVYLWRPFIFSRRPWACDSLKLKVLHFPEGFFVQGLTHGPKAREIVSWSGH